MRSCRLALAAGLLVVVMTASAAANSQNASSPTAGVELANLHDFDFQFGEWRVHHRVRRATDTQQWLEFDGTCVVRPLMDGWSNVEDHVFNKPTGVTRGVGLRAYDPKTNEWAIWWIDSRVPHGALDPPVKGRFKDGVGTYYSDGILDGKPVRARFIWSNVTPTSAHWEQAQSLDAGKTWDTNWIMEFRRVPASATRP